MTWVHVIVEMRGLLQRNLFVLARLQEVAEPFSLELMLGGVTCMVFMHA